MNSRRVYAKSHLTTWRAVTYSRTETSVSKTRRSFKDAGNVTEAKLSTSLLLLLNTRPRAPDLIRVDDDVRRTYDKRTPNVRRQSFTATTKRVASPAEPSRVAGGHVSSGRPPLPRCRRGTCRPFQSALSVVVVDVIIAVVSSSGVISRCTTTRPTPANLATRYTAA